jgi:parallel beta-helix repeat protein
LREESLKMKKKLLLAIALTLVLVSMLIAVFGIQHMMVLGTTKTWYVGPVPSDFASIQEAINNGSVSDGDIIEVKWKSTPYYENVTVNKSVTIRHYSYDPEGYYPTIDGGNTEEAVFDVVSPSVQINGCIIQNGRFGIRVQNQSVTLINNTVTSSDFGIYLASLFNTLRENKMIGNTLNFGVAELIQDIDESNTVDGNPIYYWIDQQDKTVPSEAGYVAIVNSRNIIAENLTLESNFQGVLIANSTSVTIRDLTFQSHCRCVLAIDSANVTIENFELSDPLYSPTGYWRGVEFFTVVNSTVQNIIVSQNSMSSDAISLLDSMHNTISNNTLWSQSDVTFGMVLSNSDSNYIIGNTITNTSNDMGYQSCVLLSHSHNNTIVGNELSPLTKSTRHAIIFEYSNETILYHNNFISNEYTVYNLSSFNTRWDNGREGNYWSDYQGQDDGSAGRIAGDGIGDTEIPHLGLDYYPLMEPWSARRSFHRKVNLWNGILVNTSQAIFTTSNSTLASFEFNRELKQISLKATSGFSGVLNITIPRDWLDGPFNVSVDGESSGFSMVVNENHTSIYITYASGCHTIAVIGTELRGFPGDVDGNGIVDIYDVVKVTAHYGEEET